MYKIIEQRMEPEWTKSVRFLGRTISVQLADIDGDGTLEVVGNRYNEKVGLNSFVLATKNGKPTFLVDNVDDFLFAVDLKGDGVKQTLWTQRFSKTTFFTPGQAEQVIIKKGKLVVEKPVRVPPAFRPMGAAFCNITGKDTRSLAFIDEYNRLQVVHGGRGAVAVLHIRGRRLHGGRAGVHLQLADGPDEASTRSSPHPWPSTWTGTASRSSSSLRTW